MSQAQIQRHQEETIQLQQQTEEQLHAQPEEATLQAAPVQQEAGAARRCRPTPS